MRGGGWRKVASLRLMEEVNEEVSTLKYMVQIIYTS